MMEYICPNRKICDLGASRIVDINVALPTQTGKAKKMITQTRTIQLLDLPPHFDGKRAYEPSYQANVPALETAAAQWARKYNLLPAPGDAKKIYVLDIDDQGDFDFQNGSLFVAGRSGTGAMDALRLRTEFVYRYLAYITLLKNTMDSHVPFQVFSGCAHLNKDGNHPAAHTIIPADVYRSDYRPNPAMAAQIGTDPVWLQKQFYYYCEQLDKTGKYQLYIWPYHCLIGSPGHRLAGLMEEARLFHAFARGADNTPEIKGGNPLTEHYSIFAPEVMTTWDGRQIPGAQKNARLLKLLLSGNLVFLMGEAASHCFKTSTQDILTEILAVDPALAGKIVILRDCTTSVVVPGVVDFTDDAERAIQNFQDAGMHVVDSTDAAAIEELILKS